VTYHISVRNPKHVEKGVASMTVDGIAVDGNTIPLPTGKTEVSVEVVMG
jgi:cellobiose phosphorylase